MRRYDDPVDVRKGCLDGTEGPEQFLWRGRLWTVCEVVAHWVETGPWWQAAGAQAVIGVEPVPAGEPSAVPASEPSAVPASEPSAVPAGGPAGGPAAGGSAAGGAFAVGSDLVAEREVWRVTAARGRSADGGGAGVFDLVFDWAVGGWRLARCLD